MLPAAIGYKPGCSDPTKAHEKIRFAIERAAEVWGFHVGELVVTSLNDGQHRKGSFHYSNQACDLRTHNLPSKAVKLRCLVDLAKELDCTEQTGPMDYREPGGNGFRVLLESFGKPQEHVHAEWRGA